MKKDEKAVVHSQNVMKEWVFGGGVEQRISRCAYTK